MTCSSGCSQNRCRAEANGGLGGRLPVLSGQRAVLALAAQVHPQLPRVRMPLWIRRPMGPRSLTPRTKGSLLPPLGKPSPALDVTSNLDYRHEPPNAQLDRSVLLDVLDHDLSPAWWGPIRCRPGGTRHYTHPMGESASVTLQFRGGDIRATEEAAKDQARAALESKIRAAHAKMGVHCVDNCEGGRYPQSCHIFVSFDLGTARVWCTAETQLRGRLPELRGSLRRLPIDIDIVPWYTTTATCTLASNLIVRVSCECL